jgi:glycosyltransferase involved in cell wall biosynthesis
MAVEASRSRTLVINSSSRELDRLAAELAFRGVLDRYVRPFVGFEAKWVSLAEWVPGVGRLYRSTIGRRQLPQGLTAEQVVQVGKLWDFLSSVGLRAPFGIPQAALWDTVMHRRGLALAKKAAGLAKHAAVVVSASGIAKRAFESVHEHGGRAVLNFQMAHHRYARKLLQEEMERQPEFAPTIVPHLCPPEMAATLDDEIELADHILVGSSFAKTSFISEGVQPEKIATIPYGTDTCVFAPGPTRTATSMFRVLFVGQICQLKGISYLLRAYDQIKGPSTRLSLVGRFVGPPEVFSPYRTAFKHIQHVPYSAVPELFRDADVFVFPTLADGMGLVVLEAMASGLPVIVTASGPGDLVRHGIDGFLVPIRDSDAIAEHLEFLRAHDDIRAEMGRAARLRAQQFTWDVYAKRAADVVMASLENVPSTKSQAPAGVRGEDKGESSTTL